MIIFIIISWQIYYYLLLLVGRVSSLPQDEQENKMNIAINLNKMTNILNNNKTIKSSMKTIENKKGKQK